MWKNVRASNPMWQALTKSNKSKKNGQRLQFYSIYRLDLFLHNIVYDY